MTAVGIDVGKAALDVAIFGEPKVHRLANTAAGIRRLVRWLQDREDVRIVVEATGGYEEAVLRRVPHQLAPSRCAHHFFATLAW